jgi:predicted RNase H-like nuclease (RuvC/YqgF family)
MKTMTWCVVAAFALVFVTGCVSVKAPREVNVGTSERPQRLDSTRIPHTASHEEARAELRKAYAYVQWLEKENAELEDDKDEYKRERDKYKKDRDKYKDRLEDYEDD